MKQNIGNILLAMALIVFTGFSYSSDYEATSVSNVMEINGDNYVSRLKDKSNSNDKLMTRAFTSEDLQSETFIIEDTDNTKTLAILKEDGKTDYIKIYDRVLFEEKCVMCETLDTMAMFGFCFILFIPVIFITALLFECGVSPSMIIKSFLKKEKVIELSPLEQKIKDINERMKQD